MSVRRVVITGAAALAVVAGATAAVAAIAVGITDSPGAIHACYVTATSTGPRTVLLEGAGDPCPPRHGRHQPRQAGISRNEAAEPPHDAD